MKRLLFALFLLPLAVSAQSRIAAYLGANFPTASYPFTANDMLPQLWYPGINLAVSYEFPLLNWIELSPLVEYNHYFFHQYRGFISPPEVKQSTGDVSRTLRLMLEIRLVDRASNGDRAYLVTGFGYVVEKLGLVNVQWVPGSSEQSSSTFQFEGKDYWAHSVGMGYQSDISESFAIDVCVKYYTNYRDRFAISTNAGVAYSLP